MKPPKCLKFQSTGEAPFYLSDKFSKVEARNPYNVRNNGLNSSLLLLNTDDFMKMSFAYAGPKYSRLKQ